MTPEQTRIVIGPPGTGKTTRLVGMVSEAIKGGVPPERVAYVSFTRRAADEARERIEVETGLSRVKMRYVRTLHSLAMMLMDIRIQRIFNSSDVVRDFAVSMNIAGSGLRASDGDITGMSAADQILFLQELARNRKEPIEKVIREFPDVFNWHLVQRVTNGLRKYKEAHDYLDFTDVLEQFINVGDSPDLSILFVDEAQDLTALQWDVVRKMARSALQVVVAGDDDQAIYRWAGANVEEFIALAGRVEVLGRSHRLPVRIFEAAQSIASRIHHRRPKEWGPRPDNGELEINANLQKLDYDQSTMVLVRNTKIGRDVQKRLKEQGVFFQNQAGEWAVSEAKIRAVYLWENLRKGRSMSRKEFIDTTRYLQHPLDISDLPEEVSISEVKSRMGAEELRRWDEVLKGIRAEDRAFIASSLRRGVPLMKGPKVKVSTIHASKGGEADQVVLVPDYTKLTEEAERVNRDDELRVWYVGVTRAKKSLRVIKPLTNRYFRQIMYL